MAVNLPTTDPALDYYRPLSHGRMILIANASLPWSLALTQKYARRKRIPAANIISVAMGTNLANWAVADNATFISAFISPIAALHNSLQAQGVFMGPGTPQTVNIRGNLTSGSWVDSIGTVPLATLAACARYASQLLAVPGTDLAYISSAAALYATTWDGVTGELLGGTNGDWVQQLTGGDGAAAPTYGTEYDGLLTEKYTYPNQTALDLLGDSANQAVLLGHIGIGWTEHCYTYEGSAPDEITETPERAGQIIDTALRYGEALNPANRYQQPVLVRIHARLFASPPQCQTLSYLVWQMQGWGYDVRYTVESQTVDMEPYTPVSGVAYTEPDLNAGLVRNSPYHLMMGGGTNLEMIYPPWRTAWQPSPGGGSYLGPSEGWLYCTHGLNRGGGGGASNQMHINNSIYGAQVNILHNLLRGFTWAEAIYYSNYSQFGYVMATGDPLLVPFPRAA